MLPDSLRIASEDTHSSFIEHHVDSVTLKRIHLDLHHFSNCPFIGLQTAVLASPNDVDANQAALFDARKRLGAGSLTDSIVEGSNCKFLSIIKGIKQELDS